MGGDWIPIEDCDEVFSKKCSSCVVSPFKPSPVKGLFCFCFCFCFCFFFWFQKYWVKFRFFVCGVEKIFFKFGKEKDKSHKTKE